MSAVAEPVSPEQTPWHTVTVADLYRLQEVDERRGLTSAEAANRRAVVGPNRMAEAAPEPRWRAFVRQYADPMQIVLLTISVVVATLTVVQGRAQALQGVVHLVLLSTFIFFSLHP